MKHKAIYIGDSGKDEGACKELVELLDRGWEILSEMASDVFILYILVESEEGGEDVGYIDKK